MEGAEAIESTPLLVSEPPLGSRLPPATRTATDFEVEVLAVCGGLGELNSLVGAPVPAAPEVPATAVKHVDPDPEHDSAAEAAAARPLRDAVWDTEILCEAPDEAPWPALGHAVTTHNGEPAVIAVRGWPSPQTPRNPQEQNPAYSPTRLPSGF